MRRVFLTACISIGCLYTATAQKEKQSELNESSIVKDTAGTMVPYAIWPRLLLTGRYRIKTEKKENAEFIIYRLSDEEYEKTLETMPKPKESNFFRTGANFSHFKSTDIDGHKINTKSLAGKIIVLNFWFINCPPCIMEMPELNKFADDFKSDSSVIFIAIALDKAYDLEQFLRNTRFGYAIVDNGRYIADQYGIKSYPTNVIVDQNGKVYFHSSGLSMNTVHWLKKSIEQLKTAAEKKNATAKTE